MPTTCFYICNTYGMGCLLCVICNANRFHSLLYKSLHTYKFPWQLCVGVGWGQLIYIVFPNSRYVNIQLVFWATQVQSKVCVPGVS